MTENFLTVFDITRDVLEGLFALTDTLRRESAKPLKGKSVLLGGEGFTRGARAVHSNAEKV